jgi:hypothetical protein
MSLEARLEKLEERLGMHKPSFPYDWLIMYDPETTSDEDIRRMQEERLARSGTRLFVVLPQKKISIPPQAY